MFSKYSIEIVLNWIIYLGEDFRAHNASVRHYGSAPTVLSSLSFDQGQQSNRLILEGISQVTRLKLFIGLIYIYCPCVNFPKFNVFFFYLDVFRLIEIDSMKRFVFRIYFFEIVKEWYQENKRPVFHWQSEFNKNIIIKSKWHEQKQYFFK